MGRIFWMMAAVLLLVCCNRKLEERELDADTFVKFNDYGLVKGYKYLFKYDETTCQMVNNKGRRLLRMQSDDQSSFVNMVFAGAASGGAPALGVASGVGSEKVDVELAYKLEDSDEIITLSVGMLVLKRDQMKVWLWSREMNMGLIVSRY